MKKVNLGSGPSGLSSWINLDYGMLPFLNKWPFLMQVATKCGFVGKNYITKWPKVRLKNIKKRLPFEDKSVDFIYCSHVIEHFERWEAIKILRECRRILKKDGIMRIIVPDLAWAVKNYKSAKSFNNHFFGYEKDKVYRFSMFIRGHQWMYDKEEMNILLKEVGLKNIKFLSYQKGQCKDIKKLDLAQYKGNSLFVEVGN